MNARGGRPDSSKRPAPAGSPGRTRPSVRLRVPGSRRHLFFYRKMVVKPEQFIVAGDVVNVVDRSGTTIGCGFYNPKSEVAIRMLGAVEEGFVEDRLRRAVAFRESLKIDSDAYRVCHSEGDGLSGLVVDRYADVHTIELFSLGFFRQLDLIRSFRRGRRRGLVGRGRGGGLLVARLVACWLGGTVVRVAGDVPGRALLNARDLRLSGSRGVVGCLLSACRRRGEGRQEGGGGEGEKFRGVVWVARKPLLHMSHYS